MTHGTESDLPYGFQDLDVFLNGSILREPVEQKRQFIMPSCYGRGLRLSEIKAPLVPKGCLQRDKKENCREDLAPFIRRRGKGRGHALGKEMENVEKAENTNCSLVNGDTDHSMSKYLHWDITPPNVVEMSNIPLSLELEVLQDMVLSYGTVWQCEHRMLKGKMCVRFKMGSAFECGMLVEDFDGQDLLGMGNEISCSHLES